MLFADLISLDQIVAMSANANAVCHFDLSLKKLSSTQNVTARHQDQSGWELIEAG